MTLYEFSHNNSGGRWWLKDSDWKALEKAGWKVDWVAKQKRRAGVFKADKDGRWLGALASSASKKFATLKDAIEEWERVTGLDFFAEGCNCCGSPFSMSGGKGKAWESLSGDSVERKTVRPW